VSVTRASELIDELSVRKGGTDPETARPGSVCPTKGVSEVPEVSACVRRRLPALSTLDPGRVIRPLGRPVFGSGSMGDGVGAGGMSEARSTPCSSTTGASGRASRAPASTPTAARTGLLNSLREGDVQRQFIGQDLVFMFERLDDRWLAATGLTVGRRGVPAPWTRDNRFTTVRILFGRLVGVEPPSRSLGSYHNPAS
jgi:hypothetical protein